jgi:hypothetical protein
VAAKLSYGSAMLGIGIMSYLHESGMLSGLPDASTMTRAAAGVMVGAGVGYIYEKVKERSFPEYGWLGGSEGFIMLASAANGGLYSVIGGLLAHVEVGLR